MVPPTRRAPSIPPDAAWNETDTCWKHGPTTIDGKRHGTWRSWYASGSERGLASFVDGLAHGVDAVWTAGKDETPFDDTFAKSVARAELGYERGVLVGQRCFSADGVEVGSDGVPIPKRPHGVPGDASYIAPAEIWVQGPLLGGAAMTGQQRTWHRDGELLSEIGWRDGKHHGTLATYGYGEHAIEEPGAPVGPPLTRRIHAEYVDGAIGSAMFFAKVRSGGKGEAEAEVELAAMTFDDGKLHGLLHWLTKWHTNISAPIVVVEEIGLELDPSTLFQPRKLRGTHRIEADFDRGAVTAIRAFDAKDKRLVLPPPVANWAANTSPEQLAGYLAGGAFAHDVTAFFTAADRATELDEDAGRAESLFQRLPESHKAAAFALDAFVRRGAMPSMQTFQLYGYGFDCVKNTLHDAEDERYFGLGYDGFGDLYLLDVTTGRVRRWGHDRDPWEDGAEFASLDAFAFAILRNELVHDQRIDRSEVERCFARLGIGWLSPYFDHPNSA